MFIYPTNYISITQGYHEGYHLDFGWCSHHNQDVHSIGNGYVLKLEKQKTGGNVIYIKHDNGFVSTYAHLKSFNVKVNQNVIMGEKIGVMGNTGHVYNPTTKKWEQVGEHLDLAIYSNEKKALTYQKSDIDPFKYMYVYPFQSIREDALKKYGNKIKFYNEYEAGTYQLLFNKYIRTSPCITKNDKENCVKVKECYKDIYPYLVSTKPDDYAIYKKGTTLDITEIVKEDNGRIWGKLRNCYIVLQNKDGKNQAERVN